MEKLLEKQLFSNKVLWFNSEETRRCHIQSPQVHLKWAGISEMLSFAYPKLSKMGSQRGKSEKVCAIRRRRVYERTETYVLLEPGEEERFVSEEELRAALKGWLEKWPGKSLPPDLARFETIEEAVSFLVNSVCELEIQGAVGSVQWYEVRLE